MKLTLSQSLSLLLDSDISELDELKARWGRVEPREWSAFWTGLRTALKFPEDARAMVNELYGDMGKITKLTREIDGYGEEPMPSYVGETGELLSNATPEELAKATESSVTNIFLESRQLQTLLKEAEGEDKRDSRDRQDRREAKETSSPQQEYEGHGPSFPG